MYGMGRSFPNLLVSDVAVQWMTETQNKNQFRPREISISRKVTLKATLKYNFRNIEAEMKCHQMACLGRKCEKVQIAPKYNFVNRINEVNIVHNHSMLVKLFV